MLSTPKQLFCVRRNKKSDATTQLGSTMSQISIERGDRAALQSAMHKGSKYDRNAKGTEGKDRKQFRLASACRWGG